MCVTILDEWGAPVCAHGKVHPWKINEQKNPGNIMTRTARTLIISAAMSGLLAGALVNTGCQSSGDSSGKAASASDSAASKHDCKGMNSCKGQGGCNTGDMGCKGKNSCKGKGGCKVT
jgi:hypothetical protein